MILEPGANLPEGADVPVALANEPVKRAPATGFHAEKEKLWQALRGMADGVSVEDVLENVYLLYKIEKWSGNWMTAKAYRMKRRGSGSANGSNNLVASVARGCDPRVHPS